MPKRNTIDNFIDSRKYVKLFKIIFGVSVFTPECENGKINSKFNLLGFMTFVIWGSVYYYSLYAVINEDHTVLRKLYDTRLKHYGDAVEVLATTALVVYGTWKAPFDLSGNVKCVQCIVDIDLAIEELGENLNFKRDLNKFLMLPLLEIAITITRVISTYNLNLDSTISITKMIQMLASDYIAFILTVHFCFFLYILQIRYEIISKVLENIQKKESREFVIIRVRKHINNGIHPQDIYLCDKLKKCGKICSMLHDASVVINKKFGFAVVCTMVVCLALVVLYLYYFMEATASGLFHDPKRYINFMVYVLWVIIYALFLIFLSIYFCESAVEAAKKITDRAHDIINSNMDLSVSREAANLSLQMLHQTPVLSGCGLAKFNYELILEGTKSVVTFLNPESENSKSFLEYLIELSQADRGFNEVELREEMMTLLIAGTDTSALATSYTLLLLAKYPKIQEKAYQEILEVFQGSDRRVVKEDLHKLKYVEMVIKESMRLYPPVPFIVRKIETELPLCTQYATLAIKTTLATNLRKYKIVGQEESSPIPNIPCKFEIMMKAVDGYHIAIEERKVANNM